MFIYFFSNNAKKKNRAISFKRRKKIVQGGRYWEASLNHVQRYKIKTKMQPRPTNTGASSFKKI
jgi:hypothetical protein